MEHVKEHYTVDASEDGVRGVESVAGSFQARRVNVAERDSNVQRRCYRDHRNIWKLTCVKINNIKGSGMKGLYSALCRGPRERFGFIAEPNLEFVQ